MAILKIEFIMKYFFCFGLTWYLYFSTVSCYLQLHRNVHLESNSGGGKPANPLILTNLINRGKTKEARMAAEVTFKDFKDVKSYSGYLTVNDRYDSNLFFWFFPSKTDYENAPVVLWLQGGPGGSSIIGLFAENGPFELTPDGDVMLREHSWTNNHSVIYIDNPVGTGFSFTDDGGYAKNQTTVAAELYTAVQQFFQVFPELLKNEFYVTGESYAGKYVPAIAYAIHKNNPSAKQKINLQGLAVGDGWCDPEHQLVYGDYLYQIGLIDSNDKAKLKEATEKVVKYIHNKQWLKARTHWDNEFLEYFRDASGFDYFYNYLEPDAESFNNVNNIISNYLQRKDVRAALHVDNASFVAMSSDVYFHLAGDVMKSVAPWISELLNHYRIVFYNGQLDIIVAYPLTVNFLQHLNFSAAEEYKTAARHTWLVDSEIAGFVKQAGNITEVLVRNAGHLVPSDQPLWALDLITRFTRNIPFY